MPAVLPLIEHLMAGLIDYAGLFPPAGLSMEQAVRNYAASAGGPTAWVLGRFVVPARRLRELGQAFGSLAPSERGAGIWPLTALLGPDVAADLVQVRSFNLSPIGDRARIVAVEGGSATAAQVRALRDAVPEGLRLFVEFPLGGPVPELARAAREAEALAKARIGGICEADIPSTEAILRFLEACAAERLGCKVTAGLHHPVRRLAPLTYEPGSACATMFGYLNLLLSAAACWQGRSRAEARDLLQAQDVNALAFSADRVRWGSAEFTIAEVAGTRTEFVRAIGSCSFTEPVEELRQLGVVLGTAGVAP